MRLNESKQRFSIRKLTIGAASVLIGTTFYLASGQTVHADTVSAEQQTVQTNKSDADNATSDTENDTNKVTTDAAQTVQSQDQKSTDATVTLPKTGDDNNVNDQSADVKDGSKAQVKVASNADANESNQDSSTDDNTEAPIPDEFKAPTTFPEANVADWKYSTNDQGLEVTDYIGEKTNALTIPNTADFIKAGKLQEGQKAEISSTDMRVIINQAAKDEEGIGIKISDTDGAKLYAKDSNWAGAFGSLDEYVDADDNFDDENQTNPSEDSTAARAAIEKKYQDALEAKGFENSDVIGSLTSADLNNLDTSNITDMGSLFAEEHYLQSVNISDWDTSHVTNMASMFYYTPYIKSLDLSNWNTSNVKNMAMMFQLDNDLQSISGISNWDTSSVKNMNYMFFNDTSYKEALDLSKWNTSNVEDFTNMFMQFAGPSLNLSNWDFTKANARDTSSSDDNPYHTEYTNLGYGYTNVQQSDDNNSGEVVAGNTKGNFLTYNLLTVSNTQPYMIGNSVHTMQFVNDKGEVLTVSVYAPSKFDGNSTDFAGAQQDIVKFMNEQLTRYIDGYYDNISENDLEKLIESSDFAYIGGFYEGKIPRDLFKTGVTLDSVGALKDDVDISKLPADVQAAINKGIISFQDDDNSTLNTGFKDMSDYLKKFFGITDGNANQLMLSDTPDTQDYPNKPLAAAANGTIRAIPRYVDVTKDHENDTDPTTATQWTVRELIDVSGYPSYAHVYASQHIIKFTRTATKDLETGEITYSPWNAEDELNKYPNADSATFSAYHVQSIPGYTASITPAQTVKDIIPAQTVRPGDDSLVFNIVYTANPQTGKISYVDDSGNEVGTTILSGKTDDTIDINPVAPEGYVIDSDQDIPESVTATADGIPTVTVKVIKKATATGIGKDGDGTQETLPTKQIIIYKDSDGNVVGTQDINGKVGDQVATEIPAGYYSDTTSITIPEDGVAIINITKKSSSNGDSADSGQTNGNYVPNTPDTPSTTSTTPAPDQTPDNHDASTNGHVLANDNKHGRHGSENNMHSGVNANSVNANANSEESSNQSATGNELPQTSEKETSTTSVFGMLAIALGSLMGFGVDRKKKRN